MTPPSHPSSRWFSLAPGGARCHGQVLAGRGLLGRAVVHRPPLPEYGTMHSKVLLLLLERGIRLVITTSNFIHSDSNAKAQCLWWQDFPPKQQGQPAGSSSEFERDLTAYVESLKLPVAAAKAVLEAVRSHDFGCARVKLIGSVPGNHVGPEMRRCVITRPHEHRLLPSATPPLGMQVGAPGSPAVAAARAVRGGRQ